MAMLNISTLLENATPGQITDEGRATHATQPQSTAALRWVAAGWQDLRTTMPLSLALGAGIAALVWAGQLATDAVPQLTMPAVVAGAAFAPFALAVFYSLSRASQSGEPIRLAPALAEVRANVLAIGTLSLLLTLIAIAGLRVTAIGIALSLSAATPATLLTDLSNGGVVPAVAFVIGSTVVALVFFVMATFSVPALHAGRGEVFSSVTAGIAALRSSARALPLWAMLLLVTGAAAAWLSPLVLMVAFPLLAFANWHGFNEARSCVASGIDA